MIEHFLAYAVMTALRWPSVVRVAVSKSVFSPMACTIEVYCNSGKMTVFSYTYSHDALAGDWETVLELLHQRVLEGIGK